MSMQFLFGADFIGVEVPTGVFPNKRKKKKNLVFSYFFPILMSPYELPKILQ